MAGAVTNAAATQTTACAFVPAIALTCTGVRFYGFSGSSYKVSLWSGGVRLQTITTGALGSSGVTIASFSSGQVLTPYVRYYVSVWEVTGTNYLQAHQSNSIFTTNYLANPNVWIVGNDWYYYPGDGAPNGQAGVGYDCYPVEPVLA
jgi:hypothetical protein